MATEQEKANCKRKKRYANSVAAERVLNLVNPGRRAGKPYRIYKCNACGGYHLSSKPPK